MKRLTTILFLFLFAFVLQGQSILLGDIQYGDELIVNGTFDDPSLAWWDVVEGVIVSDGLAHLLREGDSWHNYLDKNTLLEVGKKYIVEYDILNWVDGDFGIFISGAPNLIPGGNINYSATFIAEDSYVRFRSYGASCHADLDNFSIKEITKEVGYVLTYDGKVLTGVNELYVGATREYTTINAALAVAHDGDNIHIDAGIYNEQIDLTSKRVNMYGSGNSETIIFFSTESTANLHTISIGTNSTFENLVFDKWQHYAGAVLSIIDINGCSPVFTDCKIGQVDPGDTYQSKMPMRIYGNSIVYMNDCIIDASSELGSTGDNPYLLSVEDNSEFYFTGESFLANLRPDDNAYVEITVDTFKCNPDRNYFTGYGKSETKIHINTKESYWDNEADVIDGNFSSNSYSLYDSAKLTLSGNQITGGSFIYGDSCEMNFNKITSTLGHFWCRTHSELSDITSSIIDMDSCHIVLDADNAVTGYHLLEITRPIVVTITNSYLEFSGYNGNWNTRGQPLELSGADSLYMDIDTVIDNCNDGVGYAFALHAPANCVIKNTIITNQNWDGTQPQWCLRADLYADSYLNERLENVIFNNSEANTTPLFQFNNMRAYTDNDFICPINLTNNSSAVIFNDQWGSGLTNYAILTGNCPDP